MPTRIQRFLGLAAAVVLLLISYWSLGRNIDDSDMQIVYAFVFNFLAMLLACVVSATAIAQEKESDTWTLLLTTPLTGWQIVRGKTLGLLKRFLWPTVFVAAHFGIFTVFGVLSVWVFLGVLWVILMFNLIWLATGIYLSLRVKKSTLAVILNLLLPVAAYLLTFLIFVTLAALARSDTDDWINWILYYLPYFYLATTIEKLDNDMSWLPYMQNVDHLTFALVTLTVGVVHVLVSWSILRYTGYAFDRIVGRAKETGSK
jgi:ABC-type transport system involved in multi-copper enzyme maturation permease subunit